MAAPTYVKKKKKGASLLTNKITNNQAKKQLFREALWVTIAKTVDDNKSRLMLVFRTPTITENT